MRLALALALAGAVAVSAAAASGHDAVLRVPRGFSPETAAAYGANDLWVLGEYRRNGTWLLGLVRSTDGGRHFRRVVAPPSTSEGTPTIVFANARDGYAYVAFGTPLYATHDGGHIWRRVGPNRHVDAFAVAGGYAYLVAGRHRVERSRVGRNSWRELALRASHRPFSLAARGADVWLLGPPRRRPDFDTITLSSDRGRTFTTARGPCLAELGGTLVPTAGKVVWAVCPTGNMGELALSQNGGRSFPTLDSAHDPGGLRQPGLINSAQIAAASARVAVLSRGAEGALLRTTDAGRHWRVVKGTASLQAVFSLGFSTSRVGTALVQTRSGTQLWRTTDAGAIWHSVRIR